MKAILLILSFGALAIQASAQTIATFRIHRIGTIEIELFDDKPVTVSNFLKYASSGRFENQIIHRWVPGFVIQGGGYRVDTSNPEQYQLVPVDTYGTITNEAQADPFRSNVYGTIAMARVGSNTNSATSQWYINLADNGGPPPVGSDLDTLYGGYTVFGRVISNTNIINLFVPPSPANGIYIRDDILFPPSPMPVLTTNELTWNDLVYVELSLRRDMNLKITWNPGETRQGEWMSVAGLTNAIEYSSDLANWLTLTNALGTGDTMRFTESSDDTQRYYRVKLLY